MKTQPGFLITEHMKNTCRTEAEIQKKITSLVENSNNFCSDNYGSESADNGNFELFFSEYSTEETLKKFAKWLLNNEDIKV